MFSRTRVPLLGIVPSVLVSVIVYIASGTISADSYSNILSNEEEEITAEEGKSFKEILEEAHYKLINENTSEKILQNVLIERMFPNYKSEHKSMQNALFEGSPEIILKGEEVQSNDGKKAYILSKNSKTDTDAFKQACITALNKPSKQNIGQLPKLREWCTIPTIKDVLRRHKFRIASSDGQFKTILESDWFKNNDFIDKQSFLTKEETTHKNKVQNLKNKCINVLQKPFERTNFPATTDLLKNLKNNNNRGQKADEFQEAALFCTVPMTAEDYVNKAMQGSIFPSTPGWQKYDYCSINDKEIDYYKTVKTTDPMEGKTFWCAVKMIYEKFQAKPIE